LLIALAKWRRPEARLIALLACVPQTAASYEALPLILALRSSREAMIFGIVSVISVAFVVSPTGPNDFAAATATNAPITLATMYVPTLVMVLRRPNTL
jgi:hypothetical protein